MNGFVIPLSKTIQLLPQSLNGFVQMPSVEKDLNDAYITNIFVETATQQAFGPGAIAVIPASDLPKCGLVLKDENGSHARIDNVPLYEFVRSLNSGISSPFKPFIWSPSNSGVQINDPAGITASTCFLITVCYIPKDEFKEYVELYMR